MTQFLIPGYGYFDDTTIDRDYLVPGYGYGNEQASPSVTVAGSTYTYTGATVTLGYAYVPLTASGGSYSIAGATTTFYYNCPLTLAGGSYALAGATFTLQLKGKLQVAGGTYAITGAALTLHKNCPITLGGGTYALSGHTVTLVLVKGTVLGPGTYQITGHTAALIHAYYLTATGGTYRFQTIAVTLKKGRPGWLDYEGAGPWPFVKDWLVQPKPGSFNALAFWLSKGGKQPDVWGFLNEPRWTKSPGPPVNYTGKEAAEPEVWRMEGDGGPYNDD
jgi:hypothetical protein